MINTMPFILLWALCSREWGLLSLTVLIARHVSSAVSGQTCKITDVFAGILKIIGDHFGWIWEAILFTFVQKSENGRHAKIKLIDVRVLATFIIKLADRPRSGLPLVLASIYRSYHIQNIFLFHSSRSKTARNVRKTRPELGFRVKNAVFWTLLSHI